MSFWLEVPGRNQLTPEQQKIVALPSEQHLLVLGPPGSGKTVTLLYRADKLRTESQVSDERFLIVVFTNVLTRYIKSILERLNIPVSSVRTFDSWCFRYHTDNIESVPRLGNNQPDFEKIRKNVKNHLERRKPPKLYHFLLIDEGQDLDENAFKIATFISQHVTVFGDDKQQLYDAGISMDKVERVLSPVRQKTRKVHLLYGFRCTKFITHLASEFIDAPEEKLNFLQQHLEAEGAKQQPVLYLAKDQEDEMACLIENIRVRLDKTERLAILVPTSKLVPQLVKSLSDAGLDVETTAKITQRHGLDCATVNFSSPKMKIIPFPSAKGLTLDSVFMPYLERENFSDEFTTERIRKWIFVGISRTTNWIYFSGREGKILFYEKFARNETEGYLQINRHHEYQRTLPENTDSDPTIDDDSSLIDLF